MKKLYYQVNQNTKIKKNQKNSMLIEVELVEKKGHGIAEVCIIKPVKGYWQISVKEKTLKIL